MATGTPTFKGKLRNKIFFFMAIVGIVPLLVAAGLTYYVVTSSHRDDVAKVESAVLTETGNEVQNFITDDILTQTSVEIPYGANIFSSSSIPAQQYVLTQTLGALPFLQSEAYVNLQGQETAAVSRAAISGTGASPLSTSTPSLPDIASSQAFQAAKTGADYLSPVTYSGTPLEPVVTFASPVNNNEGEILGVITGTASIGSLQQIVASGTIGQTGYLYLVDQNGALIAGGGNFTNDIGSVVVAQSPVVDKVISGTDALTSATQARYKNAFGVPVVAAGKALPEDGQYWGLVAEWPTSEADAVIDALLIRDAMMLLAVFLIILVLSGILASIIVHPVRKLEEAAARVAQGKFNEGVNIRTGDEIEELGNSFNDMVLGLKQLEQLKDEFVFIAAHELRTPVAAMKGYLQLILEGTTGAIPDATRAYIEKVIGSNQRLIQLVNDLLEVARSQAGRLTIKVAPVDITPPLASTLDELKSLADEKAVTMTYDATLPGGGPLPKVMADADRVKEVAINLIGNAIKYMGGAGKITVTHELVAAASTASASGGVGVARTSPTGSMLVTHIADTGLGISPAAQKKLFEKFYRVSTDKTREIQGTGLGLFIVKEIIEKMDGTISVASEEGKGSTFSFALKVGG